ncbi:hypothetical protein, partial sequence, partial [Candidatus Phytoplasma solani]
TPHARHTAPIQSKTKKKEINLMPNNTNYNSNNNTSPTPPKKNITVVKITKTKDKYGRKMTVKETSETIENIYYFSDGETVMFVLEYNKQTGIINKKTIYNSNKTINTVLKYEFVPNTTTLIKTKFYERHEQEFYCYLVHKHDENTEQVIKETHFNPDG